MTIATLNPLYDENYLSLLTIKVVMWIFILSAVACFIICLAGVGWQCFEERRQSTNRRQVRLAARPTKTVRRVPVCPETSQSPC